MNQNNANVATKLDERILESRINSTWQESVDHLYQDLGRIDFEFEIVQSKMIQLQQSRESIISDLVNLGVTLQLNPKKSE